MMKKTRILSVLLGMAIGVVLGAVAAGKIAGRRIGHWRELVDKNYVLFLLMNKWMKTKQEGKHIREYLEKNDYKSVAVYGMSHVGKCLMEELKDCAVEIKYAVDRNAAAVCPGIDIYAPEDSLPEADVMIVTAVYYYNEIYNELKDKVEYPIVSLEDILFDIGRQ